MSIVTLKDQSTHDAAVAKAESGTPTIIYVSFEPSPICRAFTSHFAGLAGKHQDITFCQIEYDKETSPMLKFGPQHTPIMVMIEARRCQTLLQPSVRDAEAKIQEFFARPQ